VPSLTRSPQVFERALLGALGDRQAGSVAFNLFALAGAATTLRERLSLEHWRPVRAMQEDFLARTRPNGSLPGLPTVLMALDHLAVQLAAVTGAQIDRMTRDHGWRLLTMGRLVERLIAGSRHFGALIDGDALRSASGIDLLLELFDSAITFRARYQRHDELLAITDVLVLDPSNPRAFACVLRWLRTELDKLPGDPGTLQSLLALLPTAGVGFDLEDLRDADDEALLARLRPLCERLGAAGAALSDEIGRRYFTHAGDARLASA
jgi:uncharacterized alpha-E superfamily protein